MFDSKVLARRLSSARRILQQEGFSALAAAVRRQADIRFKLFAARKTKSICLDGCTFNLHGIPPSRMKIAMLSGEYEEFERRAVSRYVDPEQPVIELGACVGVVACITNRLLRNPEAHIVVEANPSVIPLLEESRQLNQCQFEIVNAAIIYDRPCVTFTPDRDLWANSLKTRPGESTVTVHAIRLADLVKKKNFQSFTLICDIEGYEYELVLREPEVLLKADTIILETHGRLIGEQKTTELLKELSDIGFRTVDQELFVVVLQRA